MSLLHLPRRVAGDSLRIGPNNVHAAILHGPSTSDEVGALEAWMAAAVDDHALRPWSRRIEDLGWSRNVLTTASQGGRDMAAAMVAGKLGYGITSSISTGATSTSLTDSGAPFVASAYIGMIVVAEETTNAPVWGVIISNTTTALTIDGWKNGDGSAGTTPGATSNFGILPGAAPYRYMALTEDAGAASAASTSLAGELTTGGCGRAFATYAHTLTAATATLAKTFSVTGTFPAIHKIGLFQVSTASSALIGFEVVLNADASVVSGDSLAVTWTLTLS